MKEQAIKLRKNKKFMVQILDDRIAWIREDVDEGSFFADTDEWIFDLYRLLKKADELKAFEHLKFDGWDEETDTGSSFIYIP